MKWVTFIAGLLAFSSSALAQNYQTTIVAEGLEFPWSMAQLPDGRLLVTERAGRLRIISPEGNAPPLSVSGLPEDIWVDGQAGLFEVKLAPDFASSNRIFLSYACGTADANTTCLARGQLQDDSLHGVAEVFRALPEREGSAHYGGRFVFLPDATLVMGLGDGFDYREEAQRPQNHIGSVIRINQDGSVPPDNPFVHEPPIAGEIYSFGLRNVQGIVFDTRRNRLLTTDHGPQGGDEVNLMHPGANYGWPLLTDGIDYNNAQITPFEQLPGMASPLHIWTPSVAPSSLALYRGEEFSAWDGDYFVSTLAAKDVRRLRFEGSQLEEKERLFAELGARIRYVTQTAAGGFYLLTDEKDGQVIRVTAN